MSARYIVRFDDICPTMNWSVWARVEAILDRHGVRPIVAVVPDNRDPKLTVQAPHRDFWPQVRRWQAKRWTIALHGYQHVYETAQAGIVGINDFSEFAGLDETAQRHKLNKALAIFEREGVRADAWVAPAHSFDNVTVRLLVEAGITVISDGLYFRPVRQLGALWVPQQLWRFRRMPAGLWTVCYHHNGFDDPAIARFDTEIATYAERIADVPAAVALADVADCGAIDHAFARLLLAALRLKRLRARQ